jgi:hypothetical protein
MQDFATRTGLLGDAPGPSRRYLWTDAFAVCNFLAPGGDGEGTELALRLIDRVHHTLEAFWLEPEHRGDAHRDIDEVMLATSLIPDGFLRLA